MFEMGSSVANPRSAMPLPPNVKQVDVDRFRSPLSYRQTIRWLEKRWTSGGKKIVFQTIVDQPGVVAAHAQLTAYGATVRGVNVSRIGKTVQIFLIR